MPRSPPAASCRPAASSTSTRNHGPLRHQVETLPKQQNNTTYQGGTVFKLKNVTLDLDAFHIHFQSGYSSQTDAPPASRTTIAQPSSISKGFEGQTNLYMGHGLSAYLNATWEKANYTGFHDHLPDRQPTSINANPYNLATPPASGSSRPHPTPMLKASPTSTTAGMSASSTSTSASSTRTSAATTTKSPSIPFDITNTYLNYTIRSGSRFDQTKIRLSVNNLFNLHDATGITSAGSVTGTTFTGISTAGNSKSYTNPFVATVAQAPLSGADTISIFAGRSIVLSVTFGLSPRR